MTDRAVLVNVREAAARLGLGYVKTYELLGRNELQSIRVGTRRLIPVAALDEFVARKLAEQNSDAGR